MGCKYGCKKRGIHKHNNMEKVNKRSQGHEVKRGEKSFTIKIMIFIAFYIILGSFIWYGIFKTKCDLQNLMEDKGGEYLILKI